MQPPQPIGASSVAAQAGTDQPGTAVMHPVWGNGVIVRLVNGGRHWIVRLDDKPGTPIALPAREFEVLAPPAAGQQTVPAATPAATPKSPPRAAITSAASTFAQAATSTIVGASRLAASPTASSPVASLAPLPSPAPAAPALGASALANANARQALEALRLGVVPPAGLSRLTVGRAAEQRRITTLARNARGMVVLSGGYGTGKTHLVELAEAEGLAANMLVARAAFDPDEVPPSHPLRIYSALMNGLRYPEGAGRGLAPLFDRLSGSPAHAVPDGASAHRWLTPALWAHTNYAGGGLAAELAEWVQGVPHEKTVLNDRLRTLSYPGKSLLVLPDWRTFGQVMAHLLGGVATWAREAGWNGLLVLLDEAEYFDHLDTTSRGMAENVLRYLAMGSQPDEDLPFEPASLYRGGQPVHQNITPRFRADQPLAVLCAFTPNPHIDEALPGVVRSEAVLHLDAIPASTFPQLADNVLRMVQDAHPSLVSNPAHEHVVKKALATAWESGRVTNTRQAARMLVEHWDLFRFDPARAVRALRSTTR